MAATWRLLSSAAVTVRTLMVPEPAFRYAPLTKYGVPPINGRTDVHSRFFALGAAAAVLALAGCTDSEATASTVPTAPLVEEPAASAGGACILWDYAFIQQKIGTKFTVAAAGQVDDTSTCVVQTEDANWPDLALTVVESTKADADLFLDDLMPERASKLKGLGKAAYRLVTEPSGKHGPVVEIGWLSEAHQLQTLKFTFPAGATADQVSQMSTRLGSLAKAMDTTDG